MSVCKEAVAMLKTIINNYEVLANKEVEKSILARTVEAIILNTYEKHSRNWLAIITLIIALFNFSGITNACVVFGYDLPEVREKIVRRKPMRVETEYVEITNDFYQFQNFFTITVDLMLVNEWLFLTNISRKSDSLLLSMFWLVQPIS